MVVVVVVVVSACSRSQARAQSWKGMYHLLEAFGERFEQRQQAVASGGNVAHSKASALLLPNWFEDAAEYRLKKSLVRKNLSTRGRVRVMHAYIYGSVLPS